MGFRSTWENVENVLCIRLDGLGDVLMTTPALRAIKETRPGCRLTLMVSPAGAQVATLVPEVDEIIVYEAPWMKVSHARRTSGKDFAMADLLRARVFDGAVIFTVYSQNPLPAAFLCYLAEIPLRLAHCRENPYQLLTDWIPDPEPHRQLRHEVQRQLDLVASVSCQSRGDGLSLQPSEASLKRARELLQSLRLEENRWIIVHPGATAPSRRYPPEAFAAAARSLTEEKGWRIIFTGDSSERELIREIQSAMGCPSISLAGKLSVEDLAALISLAPVLVVNNTGPAHMAAAVGTPVVSLYSLTNPQHTPWRVPSRVLFHDVPCKNCYKSVCPEQHQNCLRLVPPAAVVSAVHELVRQEPAGAQARAMGNLVTSR
jgi:lipopolysaccharide heptosyltransferase II